MLYHGFYVEFVPVINIPREDKNGDVVYCNGYEIKIFSDSEKKCPVNVFYAAEGFEIVTAVIDEAEQFAKDVIDIEQKNTGRENVKKHRLVKVCAKNVKKVSPNKLIFNYLQLFLHINPH